MAQRESRRSRDIMDAIRAQGYFCFKVHGSEFMMAGLPDIIICAEGYFIGLEVKHPETEQNTSARQEYVAGLINNAGGIARVVTSPSQALAVIRETLAARQDTD